MQTALPARYGVAGCKTRSSRRVVVLENYSEVVAEKYPRSSHCKPLPVKRLRWVLGMRPVKSASHRQSWHLAGFRRGVGVSGLSGGLCSRQLSCDPGSLQVWLDSILAADLKVSATFGRLSAAVLCFHRHSRFIRIEKQLPDGTDSELWGLQCPEETGQDSRRILTEQRLARIADAQGPRLRRPV